MSTSKSMCQYGAKELYEERDDNIGQRILATPRPSAMRHAEDEEGCVQDEHDHHGDEEYQKCGLLKLPGAIDAAKGDDNEHHCGNNIERASQEGESQHGQRQQDGA